MAEVCTYIQMWTMYIVRIKDGSFLAEICLDNTIQISWFLKRDSNKCASMLSVLSIHEIE